MCMLVEESDPCKKNGGQFTWSGPKIQAGLVSQRPNARREVRCPPVVERVPGAWNRIQRTGLLEGVGAQGPEARAVLHQVPRLFGVREPGCLSHARAMAIPWQPSYLAFARCRSDWFSGCNEKACYDGQIYKRELCNNKKRMTYKRNCGRPRIHCLKKPEQPDNGREKDVKIQRLEPRNWQH